MQLDLTRLPVHKCVLAKEGKLIAGDKSTYILDIPGGDGVCLLHPPFDELSRAYMTPANTFLSGPAGQPSLHDIALAITRAQQECRWGD